MKKLVLFLLCGMVTARTIAQQTQKPMLYGSNWMAITGKPMAATAGSMIFQQGGNAVDAACAMLAATCTMWDTLSWGGETQALIYNPKTGKVIAINAMGIAPTGATVDFFKSKGYNFPPEYGPLAATTPGTPGGLIYMLSQYGTMSLGQVLAPSMQMAAGYAIEAQAVNSIERDKERIKTWPYSKKVFLTHPDEKREAPAGGEIFVQKDLLSTLTKMVEAEKEALKKGKSRKEALMAAYDRFYKGDIAREFVRGSKEQGGLITMEDLAKWKPVEEAPLTTNYKGIEVYKLQQWTQGPMLLQALNILENFNLKEMGYNSPKYIHTVYQAMNMAFADRDFYYGDPNQAPTEPMKGLLSKDYAKQRASLIQFEKNDDKIGPGDPYPFQGQKNPYLNLLKSRGFEIDTTKRNFAPKHDLGNYTPKEVYEDRLWRGTTSIEAADKEGWVVSVTPSGGWLPACIAGNTGIGMSQRMQSFVLDSTLNPFNVVAPGKRPRVTLSPSLFLKDGKPYVSAAVQGGDTQDQNLLQFFLNMAEFGMTVQKATEAANFNTNQLWLSLGGSKTADRAPKAGQILLNSNTKEEVRTALKNMGYILSFGDRTSGPINAIYFDREHGSLWGGSSNHGEDYGIGW
ncbi:gamma-glutamyltransferase family protein [Pedobacter sp. HDW13]|uniref:gamma-glutamyltransferase family protein n=1 Tax=unclassified Pedobacter TaxID=2628915 RepID=UPI000F5AD02A|nr:MULTISPECIES: gamma-glutamyltransferase [unclassified Pedobacter]QIL41690.1 gamma-glutamyltransferase family protein [Pedobacter sp. HDW13]RQO73533.1 gamma-glutamyltransferase [Pedobacter sp. KBW01]